MVKGFQVVCESFKLRPRVLNDETTSETGGISEKLGGVVQFSPPVQMDSDSIGVGKHNLSDGMEGAMWFRFLGVVSRSDWEGAMCTGFPKNCR